MADAGISNESGPRPRQRVYGKHRGTVNNNVDPQSMGRIQAMVPEVLQVVPTGWAMPCVPVAGIKRAVLHVSPLVSVVWIEFEAGYVSRPIWSLVCWGSVDAPNEPPSPGPPLHTQLDWGCEYGLDVVM